MNSRHVLTLAACGLIALLVAACAPTDDLTPTPINQPSSMPSAARATMTATSAPSATAMPTATPTYPPVDYAPLIDQIKEYVKNAGFGPKFDMAVGFVDLQTGQSANFDGDTRHVSLSTFKGPLGAYALWLAEQGEITLTAADREKLVAMLNESDNGATSCMLKRVGGLAGFNDWLAAQGMTRQNNFVARWENWGCSENGQTTILPIDPRYDFKGDPTLKLPGNYALQVCAPHRQRCAEAFAPVELAKLYGRLYRGEVLNEEDTSQWLAWMAKKRENIALVKGLPAFAPARAYVKNGFDAQDAVDPLNYYHEAGIVETPYGVYALAVFTQGYPDWPATAPVEAVGKMVYDYFSDAYRGR